VTAFDAFLQQLLVERSMEAQQIRRQKGSVDFASKKRLFSFFRLLFIFIEGSIKPIGS
jgi:hypothetical protein